MSPPALRIAHLAKSYGKASAVRDLDLEIAPGEFFGLVGENGAGKTTLIKCTLDFCEADAGQIEIFGADHRRTEGRARIAYLPERFVPPYYFYGRDFLRYSSALHRRPYAEDEALAVLAALELDAAALDKPVRAYSKGMTQKLGLAACLLSGKDLYILDEPTSGLDPKARALLKRELKARHAAGKTLIMTSHALPDVGEMCTRMAVIHRGRLRYAGTPEAFAAEYGGGSLEQAYLECISRA
jgi:ABC-2 type transport system ATP-binding protein